MRTRSTYGWAEVSRERKQEIIQAIVGGGVPRGPVFAELDLTDRCNVACYFCNQQDVRTKEFVDIHRVRTILDELAEGGLKSVRLSGGGDPLYHRNATDIFDLLAERGIVVDNLTTNAALMGPEIVERLVRHRAREVVVSLNAVDGEDYARMMKVKPAIFDRVVTNVRSLVAARQAGPPSVVLQFLIDRENYRRLPDMYRLGRELGVDIIVINPVMNIPLDRIDSERLLHMSDIEQVRPYVMEILALDRESGTLQMSFPWPEWNQMFDQAARDTSAQLNDPFKIAPTFKDENGGCFFGWYTMTIRGNGDLYPCCLLMNPDYEPLGNASEGSVLEHWRGPRFRQLRTEMREVLLRRGKVFFRPTMFRELRKQCVEPWACWLKNAYFRGDETFYGELSVALDEARRKEVGLLRRPAAILRAMEAMAWDRENLRRLYDSVRLRTRSTRRILKRWFGLNVAGPAALD